MSYWKGDDYWLEVAKGNVPGHSILLKFGCNSNVTTTIAPVSQVSAYQTPTTAQSLEVVSTDNTKDIFSTGTGAREITVVGLSATGAEQTYTVRMNGTTPEPVSGTWLRVYRAWVSQSGVYASQTTPSHTSQITIQGAGGGAAWARIDNFGGTFGLGQTQIACYTVPLGYSAFLKHVSMSIEVNKTMNILFFKRDNILDVTAPMDAMRVQKRYFGATGFIQNGFDTPYMYNELTDIGFMAQTTTGTGQIHIEMEMILIDNNYL